MREAPNLTGWPAAGGVFASTHWSVVLAAKAEEPGSVRPALEQLARVYWPPLYAYICRQGYGEAEAQDLTQDFFLRFIERDYLRHLRHQDGRFRSFLLAFVKHFLQEQRARAGAQKRGGGLTPIPFEETSAIGFLEEPVDQLTPDQVFERRWAQCLFQRTVDRLRDEYSKLGKEELFAQLSDFQPRTPGAPSYVEIGKRFGMTEAAVKSAVQRLRARHRELLRDEIARTVLRPDQVEEEMRYLRDVLSHGAA